MELFDEVLGSLEKSKKGEQSPEIFYALLCERMASLKGEDRKKLLALSKEYCEGSEELEALHLLSSGMAATFFANFNEAIENCSRAIETFIKLNHHAGIMACSTMTSISHRSLGHLDKAQLYMKQAIEHLNQINGEGYFLNFQAITCYQAGELCQQFKKYSDAEKLYLRGLSFLENSKELKGRLESGLGMNYMQTGDMKNAELFLKLALKSIEGGYNTLLESKIYSDIGLFHLKNGDFEEALRNQLISLDIREKYKMLAPACTSYILLAENYMELNEMEKAIEFANKAIERSKQINTIIKLFEAHLILSRIFEKQGKVKEAFENYKLYHKYKDEVHNQDVIRRIEQINSQHQIETSEKEKEIFRLRNVELKSALDEIHDSFVYASRIQRSLITSEQYIYNSLKRLKS